MRNEIKKQLVDGLGQLRWQIEQQQRQGKALPPYVQFLIDGDYGDLPPNMTNGGNRCCPTRATTSTRSKRSSNGSPPTDGSRA
ncbi:MAG: hypothetical protein H6638_14950 [Ardenticatenales bacterium]|nr:hypothetical protein [Ardenticatenales bacterium]